MVTGTDDDIDNEENDRGVLIRNRVTSDDRNYDSGIPGRPVIPDLLLFVAVIDDDGHGVIVSHTTLSVSEVGGTNTYIVVLGSPPTDTVTVTPRSEDETVATVSGPLTFTPANWNDPQEVTVTGVDDAIDNIPNRTTMVTHGVSGGGDDYNDITVASLTVRVIDNETAGVTASRASIGLTETSGSSYTLVLNTPPTALVTITPASTDETVATVSDALTFTADNWNIPQAVAVTAVDDDIDNPLNHRPASIKHRVESEDVAYGSLSIDDIQIRVNDDDITITVSPTELSVNEAEGTATYTVVLDSQPTANVMVTPTSSDDTAVTVSGELIFTPNNWNNPQDVTVIGVDDTIDNMIPRTATITHTASGGSDRHHPIASVSVMVTDNETVGVTVSPTGLAIDEVGDGNTATYTIVLNTQPTAEVTVTATSNDETAATISTGSPGTVATVSEMLTFTPNDWNQPQTVTVTAVDDNVNNAPDRIATINHTLEGGGYDDVTAAVTVTVINDDTAGAILSTTELTIDEAGGTGMYTVVLFTQPTSNVTVTPRSEDGTVATVSPVQLIFTPDNWNSLQTVTVTGVDDPFVNVPNRMTRVTHTIAGGGYNQVELPAVMVTATNDDATGVVLSSTALTIDEAGGTGMYTVFLSERPTGDVTVTPTSSNEMVATVSPPSLAFSTSNWNLPQTVTVTGVDDATENEAEGADLHPRELERLPDGHCDRGG